MVLLYHEGQQPSVPSDLLQVTASEGKRELSIHRIKESLQLEKTSKIIKPNSHSCKQAVRRQHFNLPAWTQVRYLHRVHAFPCTQANVCRKNKQHDAEMTAQLCSGAPPDTSKTSLDTSKRESHAYRQAVSYVKTARVQCTT